MGIFTKLGFFKKNKPTINRDVQEELSRLKDVKVFHAEKARATNLGSNPSGTKIFF